MSEQPPWNPHGQQEPDQWQGQPPHQIQPQYPQQPYGQQPTNPGQPLYRGTPYGQSYQQDQPYGQQTWPTSGHHRRPPRKSWPRRHKVLTALGALVALIIIIGGTTTGLALTAGPSYAQPWCASTLNYMYTSTPTGTFQGYLNELQYEENQGAPTGQLLSDEEQLNQDAANTQSDSASAGFGDLAADQSDMATAKADAEAINRACGVPAKWNIGKLGVPSGL